MSLTPHELDAVCDLVHDLCGIYLDSSKEYLIASRLTEIVKKHQCRDYVELAQRARSSTESQLADDIVSAITTNETLWFRDKWPFEAVRYKLLPEIIDAKAGSVFPRRLRIWSAASSTGQEAYSLAMTLLDLLVDPTGWDIEILGTDISPSAVAKAKSATYSELEISRGLDQLHLSGYFVKNGDHWTVCDAVRSMCRFEVRNLLTPFGAHGPFDIIFCRNVAIYFTKEVRDQLFCKLAEVLCPHGWLFTGSSEMLGHLGPNWQPYQHCRAVCYQPNGTRAALTP